MNDNQIEFDYFTGVVVDELPGYPQAMVERFHDVMGAAVDVRTPEVISHRLRLLHEEFDELVAELEQAQLRLESDGKLEPENLAGISKKIADLLYVTYGVAVNLGIDAELAFEIVHESNMSKLGVDGKPLLREDGKVLQGPNYEAPDMTGTYREEEDG